MTAHIEEEVLALLGRRGPLPRPALMPELLQVESEVQLVNALQRLRVKGKIWRAPTGEWTLAGPGTKPQPQAGAGAKEKAAPATRSARRKKRSAPKAKRWRGVHGARVALAYRTPAERRAHAGSPLASPEPNDPEVEARLERAARDAQNTLDKYVASVCDPRVLGPLSTARDAAREAAETYRTRHRGGPKSAYVD